MKKYRVTLVRQITTEIEVTANNEDEAYEKAYYEDGETTYDDSTIQYSQVKELYDLDEDEDEDED